MSIGPAAVQPDPNIAEAGCMKLDIDPRAGQQQAVCTESERWVTHVLGGALSVA
jgi:hypothetical protein